MAKIPTPIVDKNGRATTVYRSDKPLTRREGFHRIPEIRSSSVDTKFAIAWNDPVWRNRLTSQIFDIFKDWVPREELWKNAPKGSLLTLVVNEDSLLDAANENVYITRKFFRSGVNSSSLIDDFVMPKSLIRHLV